MFHFGNANLDNFDVCCLHLATCLWKLAFASAVVDVSLWFSQFISGFFTCETTKWNNCTLTQAITTVFFIFYSFKFQFEFYFCVYYIMKFLVTTLNNFIWKNVRFFLSIFHSKIWFHHFSYFYFQLNLTVMSKYAIKKLLSKQEKTISFLGMSWFSSSQKCATLIHSCVDSNKHGSMADTDALHIPVMYTHIMLSEKPTRIDSC